MRYLFIIISVLLLYSCNTPSSTTSVENTAEDTIKPVGIKRGEINVLSATNDKSCSYALFVPTDTLKKYPLIVIFDPHAAGNHAASQYKDLANKYNVILAASNNIQNGMEPERFSYYANTIIDDVMNLTKVDSNFVYLMGFSGGARVASFLAQQQNVFKGLIGCGAGLNDLAEIKTTNFLYVGFAGYNDFNFLELNKSENILRHTYFKTNFKYFEGKHEWPPDSVMEYAFVAVSLDKKAKSQNSNIKNYLQNQLKKIKSIPIRDSWKKTFEMKSLKDLLLNETEFISEKNNVQNYLFSYESKTAERNFNTTLNTESKAQSDFQKDILNKDLDWWKKKISVLSSANSKTNKTPADYRDIRLLNYLSMLCYSAINQTLKMQDISQVGKYLKIYKAADPQNPDVPYLSAIYNIYNKEYKIAIDSLNSAILLGYSDKSKWKSERVFNLIKDSLRYIDLEAKLNSMP